MVNERILGVHTHVDDLVGMGLCDYSVHKRVLSISSETFTSITSMSEVLIRIKQAFSKLNESYRLKSYAEARTICLSRTASNRKPMS